MFTQRNSPSIMSQELDASRARNHNLNQAEFNKRQAESNKKCNDLIQQTVNKWLEDFDNVKQVLAKAVDDYITKIQHKFFRNDGRERAQELKKKITQSNELSQIISAMDEAIKWGNEHEDSLKTFLFKAIDAQFCSNGAGRSFKFVDADGYINFGYTYFLRKIIEETRKKLTPIEVDNFFNEDNPETEAIQMRKIT